MVADDRRITLIITSPLFAQDGPRKICRGQDEQKPVSQNSCQDRLRAEMKRYMRDVKSVLALYLAPDPKKINPPNRGRLYTSTTGCTRTVSIDLLP